jgi:integrase
MGTVFRKTFTKPLPAGAETFTRKGQRFARWKDKKGRTRTAPLTTGKDGAARLLIESPYYVAKWRDGKGVVREESTGCREEVPARRVLADLERRGELVRANVLSCGEDRVSDHQATPLAEHIAAFQEHLRAKGVTATHCEDTGRYLRRIAAECSFSTLARLNRDALETWLAARTVEGMSARTRNAHRNAVVAFGNWCADPEVGRLIVNPFAGAPKANEKADPRRQRRALTEDELRRLLAVARQRPLLDAATVRRGKRKGEAYAELRQETRGRLLLLGRERALIYKTLVLSGLRKSELESLTVAQLNLDGPAPYAALDAADEKNREGNAVPLRPDLAADLQAWACRQAGPAAGRGPPPRPTDSGAAAARYSRLQRARRAGEDPRPRPGAGRHCPAGRGAGRQATHRQARRPGPHHRRSRLADDVRYTAQQGRRCPTDGASGHEAFRHQANDGRIHRPEAARRGRRPRHPAGAAPRRQGRATGRPGDRNRPASACTCACTSWRPFWPFAVNSCPPVHC